MLGKIVLGVLSIGVIGCLVFLVNTLIFSNYENKALFLFFRDGAGSFIITLGFIAGILGMFLFIIYFVIYIFSGGGNKNVFITNIILEIVVILLIIFSASYI